jgi:hypothetical protein
VSKFCRPFGISEKKMIQVGDGMRSLVRSCNKESMINEGVITSFNGRGHNERAL